MTRNATAIVLFSATLGACSPATNDREGTPSSTPDTGGAEPLGGTPGSGGALSMGGSTTGGGPGTGGLTESGGAPPLGGSISGGVSTSGGSSTGGASLTGGTPPSGGNPSSGGVTGGALATGGTPGSGGLGDSGGETGSGGTSGAGGQGSTTCPDGLPPLVAGDHTATLDHQGRARTYTVHVPTGVSGTEPVAVVFDLHGAYGNAGQQQQMSGWQAVADEEGFLVVYPNGIDGFWNVDDTCCGTAGTEQIDDVGFVRAMIDTLNAQTCIDRQRIYASGFSNGGGLAHRIGCDAADIIAAIAPVATDLRTQPCNNARPISMLEVRGLRDSLEPYEGGIVGPPGGQYDSPGAQGSLQLWADLNQCTGTPTATEDYCESYTACADEVETTLCSLPDTDHGTYDNPVGFDIASVAWRMFERQPLR